MRTELSNKTPFFPQFDKFPWVGSSIPKSAFNSLKIFRSEGGFAIPFSTFHKYNRTDSEKMNKFITPIEKHDENFFNENKTILQAHGIWDSDKEEQRKIFKIYF